MRHIKRALENVDFILLRQALESVLDLTDILPSDLDATLDKELAPLGERVRGFSLSLEGRPLASLFYISKVLSSLTVAAAKDGIPSDSSLVSKLLRAKQCWN